MALAHDYLTQYGGAERVVLAMIATFEGAPLYTSIYHPSATFPEFARAEIHAQHLDRVKLLRRYHRLALPLLATSFSLTTIEADVVVCSSSGWAHGVRTLGRKVVYCHTPARWLYQQARYLDAKGPSPARATLGALTPPLRWWDRRSAASVDRFLVNSTVVKHRVENAYRREAEVLAPPPAVTPDVAASPVADVEPGFWLSVNRLLPYKNVGAVISAFEQMPDLRLVVVGSGPLLPKLVARNIPNVQFLGQVTDAQLSWLYANCQAIVTAAHEDFGLTPVEAASFGRPAAVLRWGGFLDTVVDGLNGSFFEEPTPELIAGAVRRVSSGNWSDREITEYAARFGVSRFQSRLREVVADEARNV